MDFINSKQLEFSNMISILAQQTVICTRLESFLYVVAHYVCTQYVLLLQRCLGVGGRQLSLLFALQIFYRLQVGGFSFVGVFVKLTGSTHPHQSGYSL